MNDELFGLFEDDAGNVFFLGAGVDQTEEVVLEDVPF